MGPNCLVVSSQQTKYCAGPPVPSFSMKLSQFDPLLAGMPSPQIHINTHLAQIQTQTKTEPEFCQRGMKSRQRKLPISPEAPQGFPLPSGSTGLPRAPPSLFQPMTGLSLTLTKGFGDISWACAASILQRKEGGDQQGGGRGQTRPCLTHENKVARSHLPPLAKQMAQQPGG